jgi:glyoxylase-like metal-dependent hydrolase (beta-lactamase superfamily II)
MPEILTLDLEFMGAREVIASYAVPTGDGGFVLLESGPAGTVDNLVQRLNENGLVIEKLRAIFVTHVHLDHSGGAGALALKSGCNVYAHPKGVPHLVDPSRLLASAERLYRDKMIPLWGRTVASPSEQTFAVEHGKSVWVEDLEIRAWHTLGHASHHVAWQVASAIATGDVGGVRFPGCDHVLPPTPPPDINVELWRKSIELVRQLQPDKLLLTHFGSVESPGPHLESLDRRLGLWLDLAQKMIRDGGKLEHLADRLRSLDDDDLRKTNATQEMIDRYRRLCPMRDNAAGLYRYASSASGR